MTQCYFTARPTLTRFLLPCDILPIPWTRSVQDACSSHSLRKLQPYSDTGLCVTQYTDQGCVLRSVMSQPLPLLSLEASGFRRPNMQRRKGTGWEQRQAGDCSHSRLRPQQSAPFLLLPRDLTGLSLRGCLSSSTQGNPVSTMFPPLEQPMAGNQGSV